MALLTNELEITNDTCVISSERILQDKFTTISFKFATAHWTCYPNGLMVTISLTSKQIPT